MNYMYGGTIRRINLSDGKISKEPTSAYSGDFLGGRGINTKILYDGVPPEIGALDPASLLIFGVGPLCGTPVPSGRTEITFKSPETGFLGSTNFGGYFGPELKFAGYDHIVLAGTGVETSVDMLFKVAGKVRTLERAYCVREGMTRETDSFPKRFMDKPIASGHYMGEVLETKKFEKMKDKYYALRGWDVATGVPTRKTLEAAGLGDVAKDLEKRGKLPNAEENKT